MKYQEYLDKRKNLLDSAQALINEGKYEEAEAKAKEVEALDDQWDAQAKAQANLQALEGNQRVQNVQNLAGVPVINVQAGILDTAVQNPAAPSKEDAYKTQEYTNAWAKIMMGQQLTADEDKVFRLVNEAYTHTTENTPIMIPETVAAGIWKEIGEMYPYWEDVKKTYVKGDMKIIKKKSSSAAAWYQEADKTDDGKEEFEEARLTGCELSRAITISWKLKAMAIDEFLPYIQSEMASEMGKALAYGVTHGKGSENEKPEPMGIVTALTKEAEKPQVVEYDAETGLTYKDLTAARGKIKSGYAPAIYANSNTIWNVLANVIDQNGRPIFIADAINGGVYRVFGCVVKEDGSMQDGEILFSDAKRGYHANINKQISVSTEEHVKERTTDYCGYAIMDGIPMTTKAHCLLTKQGE